MFDRWRNGPYTISGPYIIFALAFLVAEYTRVGDFRIFLLASEATRSGQDIYEMTYVDGFHYLYSPLFAVLTRPFTWIPIELAGTLWKLMSFLWLARTFILLRRLFFPGEASKGVFFLSFLAMMLPVYSTIHLIQLSAFLLWAVIESFHLAFQKNRVLIGSALLALAINIKLLPLVFIPYLLYRGHTRMVIYVFLFSIGYLFLPGLFIGHAYNMQLAASWWHLIDPMGSKHIIDLDEPGFHSITAFLSALLTDQIGPNERAIKRNLVDLDEGIVTWIIQATRTLLIGFTLHFLGTPPFREAKNRLMRCREVAYICLVIPLLFPHQQTYGFLFLLPAAVFVVYFLFHARPAYTHAWKFNTILVLACLAFFIIDLQIFFGFGRQVFWHFKTLTYGALLLLLVLALCDPATLQRNGQMAMAGPVEDDRK